MVSDRKIFGFAIVGFSMGFMLLIGAVVLRFSAHEGSVEFIMLSLLWCGSGLLAVLIERAFKEQSDRLDKIEGLLREIKDE
jgi:hypothetical protein